MGLFQPDAGLADPSRGNVAHRELALAERRDAPRPDPRHRDPDDDGGTVELELEGGERLAAGRVILATDAWTNDLLAPLGARLPLTITQEQVELVHAARRPRPVRPGAVPGLDLDARAASTASRPTGTRARRSARTSAAGR